MDWPDGSYDCPYIVCVVDFNCCVTLYPPNKPALTSSYFHLACALEKLGKTSRALENIKKAIDLNNTVGGLTAADSTEARQLFQKQNEKGKMVMILFAPSHSAELVRERSNEGPENRA